MVNLSCLRRPAFILALVALTGAARSQDANPWSRVHNPTPGAALSIGGPARGCLSGAVHLPADGPGYAVIHLERRRFFGHPDTVRFVDRLGRRASAAGLPTFYVGDMAQPRGGPLPFGHASHQTGIDVDLWFTFATPAPLPVAARGTIELPSMLLANWRAVDPKRFGPRQVTLLRLAATDPRVDRIFVNPVIKATLCRAIPSGQRSWLRRLRPWFGHDDHFHVRLSCPAGSPECQAQAPVPPGDGCDSVLASWVRDQRPPPPHPPPLPPRKMPVLPAECHALLDQP